MPIPHYLRGLVKALRRDTLPARCHLLIAGEQWLQLWFHGGLEQGRIYPADDVPASLLLAAAVPGETQPQVFFDGARHGYDALFGDNHRETVAAPRRLWRYGDDVYRIHLALDYAIDYAAEPDSFALNAQGQVQLADGTWQDWTAAQADGFTAITVLLEDRKGHVWEVLALDLV